MPNRGFPRLAGGVLARERAIWAGPCQLPSCTSGRPVTGVIDFIVGPRGFCRPCCDRAGRQGYSVRTEPMEGVTALSDPG